MKLKCAWCEREGRPANVGEVEPMDNRSETHGSCQEHRQEGMMRTTLAVLMLMLAPATLAAQTNTTGTLSPNTSVTPPPAASTTATPAPREAAIIVCAPEFSTGAGRLLVSSARTSAGGPTVAPGAPCAQALSDLFVAGFGVIDVLPVNQQVQYTLVR